MKHGDDLKEKGAEKRRAVAVKCVCVCVCVCVLGGVYDREGGDGAHIQQAETTGVEVYWEGAGLVVKKRSKVGWKSGGRDEQEEEEWAQDEEEEVEEEEEQRWGLCTWHWE